jgi:serine/threonine protein kinase
LQGPQTGKVLIDGEGHCRVADFGLSKLGVFNGRKIEEPVGTPVYMAPEVISRFLVNVSVLYFN